MGMANRSLSLYTYTATPLAQLRPYRARAFETRHDQKRGQPAVCSCCMRRATHGQRGGFAYPLEAVGAVHHHVTPLADGPPYLIQGLSAAEGYSVRVFQCFSVSGQFCPLRFLAMNFEKARLPKQEPINCFVMAKNLRETLT